MEDIIQKYKKEQNESHLIKKQYQFTKELSTQIQYLKNMNGWKKEEFTESIKNNLLKRDIFQSA